MTISQSVHCHPMRSTMHERCRWQDAHTAFAHRTFWIVLHGLSCWLVRRRIPLLTVDFACAEPSESAAYGQFFGAPTGFDQPISALSFDARHLRLPITRSAADLRGFLRGAPANILTGYSHDAQLVGQVTALLRARDPMDWPDFPALAAEIGDAALAVDMDVTDEASTIAAFDAAAAHFGPVDTVIANSVPTAGLARDIGVLESRLRIVHPGVRMPAARPMCSTPACRLPSAWGSALG